MIEQAKFTYSLLRQAFERQIRTTDDAAETQRKTIEDAAEKQTKYLKSFNTDQQLKLIGDLFLKTFF